MDKETMEWLRKLIGTKKKEFSEFCGTVNDEDFNDFDSSKI
jgi:hypothetical protein